MALTPHILPCLCAISELPEEQQQRWEAFVSGPLAETNKKNTVDLVSLTWHLILVSLLVWLMPPLSVASCLALVWA